MKDQEKAVLRTAERMLATGSTLSYVADQTNLPLKTVREIWLQSKAKAA